MKFIFQCPTHVFRQAQYDLTRGQSEPVEDCEEVFESGASAKAGWF